MNVLQLTEEASLKHWRSLLGSPLMTDRSACGDGLEIADEDGPLTEFVLEKREVLRRQVGASQRLSAGRLVDTYFVGQATIKRRS